MILVVNAYMPQELYRIRETEAKHLRWSSSSCAYTCDEITKINDGSCVEGSAEKYRRE